jgi:hypothetical protein
MASANRTLLLLGRRRCQAIGLFGALPGVFLFETIDAAGRIHKLLFAREERVAARADFDADVAFVGGSSFERVSARADHIHLVIGRVNSSFHDFLGKPKW